MFKTETVRSGAIEFTVTSLSLTSVSFDTGNDTIIPDYLYDWTHNHKMLNMGVYYPLNVAVNEEVGLSLHIYGGNSSAGMRELIHDYDYNRCIIFVKRMDGMSFNRAERLKIADAIALHLRQYVVYRGGTSKQWKTGEMMRRSSNAYISPSKMLVLYPVHKYTVLFE